MPTKKDCDGRHGRKAAAITAAEAAIAAAEERIRDAERRIGICEDTTEILDSLTRRLQAALQALRQVPHDLGEVYELVYAFIRRGGKMPRPGRWITGETPVPA
jgi:Tfp pilus assembly protein PilX